MTASTGIIRTIAGTGGYGEYGNGGPATDAGLFWSYGVSVDALGDVYIADTYNSVIRKVSMLLQLSQV